MEISIYIPFILTVISLVLILGTEMLIFFIWSERERKNEDHKMSSFLRQMHIENLQERKETRKLHIENQKIIRDLRQINKDNQIILHRIFERVDNLPEETSS